MMAADDSLFAVESGRDTVSHYVVHLCVLLSMVKSPVCGTLDDSPCNAVGEVLLQAGRYFKRLALGISAERNDCFKHRLSIGERSCFIEHNCVRICKLFKILSALDGDVHIRSFLDSGNYGNGHRKLYCAGIIHHQQGNCLGDISRKQQSKTKSQEAERNDAVRQCFRTALNACFQVLGVVDKLDYLAYLCIGGKAADCYRHSTLFHNGSRKHAASCRLHYCKRLACHGGLVYVSLALAYLAVHGDNAACAYSYPVACVKLGHGDKHIGLFRYQPYLVCLYSKTVRKNSPCACPCVVLQKSGYGQQEHYAACGLVVFPAEAGCDGSSVKHVNGKLALAQCAKAFPDVFQSLYYRKRIAYRHREKCREKYPLCHQLTKLNAEAAVYLRNAELGVGIIGNELSWVKSRYSLYNLVTAALFVAYKYAAVPAPYLYR